MKKVVALIPARSGSVRIKNKNIRQICGIPLLGLAVRQALLTSNIQEVYVSTDSELYAQVAKNYGAKIPFLRPAEISGSESTDYDVFRHFLDWYIASFEEMPELIVQIRPTAPVRTPETVRKAITFMQSHPEFDSLRSVSVPHQSPYKMWNMDENGQIFPVIRSNLGNCFDAPTQSLPETYAQDGIVDIVRPETLLYTGSMAGKTIAGWIDHPITWDIDTDADLRVATKLLDDTGCYVLLDKREALGGNLGIIQGRLTPSQALQQFPINCWAQEFFAARSTGYTAIEWIRDRIQNENNPIWRMSFKTQELQQVAFENGVGIRSVCDDYVLCCDWSALTTVQYHNLIELVRRSALIQASVIVYPLLEKAALSNVNKKEQFYFYINSIAHLAALFQIKIALELSTGVAETEEILSHISAPNVGLCLDTGNLVSAGHDPLQWLDSPCILKRIIHVHLKDRNSNGENVIPGTGIVDFKSIFEQLRRSSYCGLLVTETTRGSDPFETAKKNAEFFAKL